MPLSRKLPFALCLTFALAAPHPSLAQQPGAPTPAQIAEAQGHLDRGVRLGNEGDWAGAFAAFEAAYRLSRNPVLLFNMAAAQEQRNQYVEALELLQRYRAEAPTRVLTRQASELDAALGRLRSRIGTVVLALDLPGLVVLLDGVERDPAALRSGLAVSAGPHVLLARAPHYDPHEERFTVAGTDRRTLEFTLARRQGDVLIDAVPAAVTVAIDGREVSAPRGAPLRIDEGRHRVRVSAPGYDPYETEVEAGGPQAARVTARLRWADNITEEDGARLTVRTNERGGFASLDGHRIRMDGSVLVPPGAHRLRMELPGFLPNERDVELPRGGSLTVDVLMVPTNALRTAHLLQVQTAQRYTRAFLGLGIPLTAGSVAAGIAILTLYLNSQATASQLDMQRDQCSQGNHSVDPQCPAQPPITRLGMQIDQESMRQNVLYPLGAVSIIPIFLGGAALVTGLIFATNSPDPERFTRPPRFRIGAAPSPSGVHLFGTF